MFRGLIVLILIFNFINGECLYPQWKNTCQKYCMDNQLYEIQLNQCYSMDQKQLTCKCSGRNLTEKILSMIDGNNSNFVSSISSSSITSTTIEGECLISQSCTIGKIICNGLNAYCRCNNGSWISISCSKGNLCRQMEDTFASCQSSSMSGLSSSIFINQYIHFCILCLLIFKTKFILI